MSNEHLLDNNSAFYGIRDDTRYHSDISGKASGSERAIQERRMDRVDGMREDPHRVRRIGQQ